MQRSARTSLEARGQPCDSRARLYDASAAAKRAEDNGEPTGQVTLNGAGQATFITSGLFVGRHNIVAQYAGDGKFNGSQSDFLSQYGRQ